jgi:hypothetical protein
MSPRDIGHKRALIACNDPIESLDLAEYAKTRGWAGPLIVGMAQQAVIAIESRDEPFGLVLLAAASSDQTTLSVIRLCRTEGCPVIVFDGPGAFADEGPVAFINRPYTDEDLDAALQMLGHLHV